MPNRVLAGRLGVHPTTVSRWKGDPPAWAAGHIETLRKLEEALWPTLVVPQPEAKNGSEPHHNEERERIS